MTKIKDSTGKVVFSTSTERQNVAQILTSHLNASATLDFPNISANTTAELTITVTGAVVGSAAVATPNGAPESGLTWKAYVSAPNVVTIRVANVTTGPINPASRSWRADVWI